MMYEFLDKRYALAIYEIALEKNKVHEYLEDLEDVNSTMSQCDDMEIILDHPNVSIREKRELFKSIWGEKIDTELINFLMVLIEKGRIRFLKEKIEQYKILMMEREKVLMVEVVSVISLKEDQKKRIKEIINKKTGKSIVIKNDIDREILGGYTLRYSDKYIDYSLKNKIELLIQGGE